MMKRMLYVWVAAAAVALGASVFADDMMKNDMKKEPAMKASVGLNGYCPVAYVAMGKAVRGDPQYASTYMGQTFYFAGGDAKKMFDGEPSKYVVAYRGYCATAAAKGMKLASDPMLFTLHDGKLYLFSNAEAKAMFDKNPKGMVEKADAHWTTIGKPSAQPMK